MGKPGDTRLTLCNKAFTANPSLRQSSLQQSQKKEANARDGGDAEDFSFESTFRILPFDKISLNVTIILPEVSVPPDIFHPSRFYRPLRQALTGTRRDILK